MADAGWKYKKKCKKNATWQLFAFRTYAFTSPPAFHQLCSVSIIFCRLQTSIAACRTGVQWPLRHLGTLFTAHESERTLSAPEKIGQWDRGRDCEDKGGEPVYRNTFSCLHLKLKVKIKSWSKRCPNFSIKISLALILRKQQNESCLRD